MSVIVISTVRIISHVSLLENDGEKNFILAIVDVKYQLSLESPNYYCRWNLQNY